VLHRHHVTAIEAVGFLDARLRLVGEVGHLFFSGREFDLERHDPFDALEVDAVDLGEDRYYVDRMVVLVLGHLGTSSLSVLASRSTAVRCSLFSFLGIVTSMVTSRSPAAFLPAAGTPRPRTRMVVPDWVPAGTLSVTGSPRVATSTVVP